MSVFRPSARATGPDGREWEIYAYRIKLPERGPPGRLVRGFFRLLVRVLVDVPIAAVRSLGSSEWTIEAVTFAAHAETMRWTTTGEYRGQVLAQVEGSLARGDTPHPRNATSVR